MGLLIERNMFLCQSVPIFFLKLKEKKLAVENKHCLLIRKISIFQEHGN